MKCFQIMNNEVLIINDKKQYADTPENFVTDGGSLGVITAYTQPKILRACDGTHNHSVLSESEPVEVTPETVIYDDLQKCCVIDDVWYQYPNEALEAYIAALDTYIASKQEREYIETEPPTQEELNEAVANKVKATLQNLAVSAMMMSLAGSSSTTQAEEYKAVIKDVSDDVALLIPDVYPVWSADSVEYKKDDRVTYNDILYKVLQDHTSQETWKPDVSFSLFVKVISSIGGEIPNWEQPSADNAYMKGDKVKFNGKIYESVIDNNVWSPEAYPQGWKEVEE